VLGLARRHEPADSSRLNRSKRSAWGGRRTSRRTLISLMLSAAVVSRNVSESADSLMAP
jgi:hypothetical protein